MQIPVPLWRLKNQEKVNGPAQRSGGELGILPFSTLFSTLAPSGLDDAHHTGEGNMLYSV